MPYVAQCLKDTQGVIVAASDYLKVLPDSLDRWMPRRVRRSAPTASAAARTGPTCASSSRSTRGSSRVATLAELAQEGQIDRAVVAQAIKDFGIDPEKAEPGTSCNQVTTS